MYSVSKFKPVWWLTNTYSKTIAAKFFRSKPRLIRFIHGNHLLKSQYGLEQRVPDFLNKDYTRFIN